MTRVRWLWLILLVVALIVVPFVLFEDYFNTLGARLAAGGGSPAWTGAAIAAFLASDVVLPVPSSVVSAAAGALLGFWRAAAVVWIGMMASCVVGYFVGARSSQGARRLVGEDGLRRAEAMAARYGHWAIVLCRPVPVLAEASVIFAGLIGAPFGRFLWLCVWSNLGIAAAYAAIGAWSMRVESFLLAFLGATILPAVAMLVARVWFRK